MGAGTTNLETARNSDPQLDPSSVPAHLASANREQLQAQSSQSIATAQIATARSGVLDLFSSKMDGLVDHLSRDRTMRGLSTDKEILQAISRIAGGTSPEQLHKIESLSQLEREFSEKGLATPKGITLEDAKIVLHEIVEQLKEIGDETGVTQLLTGVVGVVSGLGQAGVAGVRFLAENLPDLMSGKLSMKEFLARGADAVGPAVMKTLEGALDTLIGGLRIAGELTGISDLVRGILKIANGEVISGSINLGFGIAQIAAFIGTAGGSALGGQAIKSLGKILLKWAAGQGAEEIEKIIVKRFAKSILKSLSEHSVEDVVGFFGAMCGEEAATEFGKLITERGLKNLTEKELGEFLKKFCTEKIVAWLKSRPEDFWQQPTLAGPIPGPISDPFYQPVHGPFAGPNGGPIYWPITGPFGGGGFHPHPSPNDQPILSYPFEVRPEITIGRYQKLAASAHAGEPTTSTIKAGAQEAFKARSILGA